MQPQTDKTLPVGNHTPSQAGEPVKQAPTPAPMPLDPALLGHVGGGYGPVGGW
jgi:hypothetical protein